MDLGLADRVYVVTGGSRGLGRATAEALVGDGARVVVAARTRASLDATVADLGEDRATGVVADLGDPATPDRIVEAARAAYGRLDGGLISVGGPPAGTVMSTPDEDWSRAFESVFLGALRMTRALVGAVGEGGSVALVLSSSTKAPLENLAISNGFRPGLGMVVKTLADEVGPRGIRVNALLPGRVDTERVRELDAAGEDPEATRRAMEQTIPLRRYGDPAEFGRVAAFLLSPASSFITGTMVPVDGGMHRAL
jgi:3-oxoacyl-[acyl-carrier protein] reductase